MTRAGTAITRVRFSILPLLFFPARLLTPPFFLPAPIRPPPAVDYNSASTYFGAFAANHAAQAASYAGPLLDWAGAAAAEAQVQASLSGVFCPPSALHFACHLAPWGYQSDDQSIYMHWNLGFALLPLVSEFEFTQNLTAARAALPLFQGATEWWRCFLARDNATGLLHDTNAHNPDAQHEGQLVPDPQIGLTLLLRSAAGYLDIAVALGLPPPAAALDIIAHLTPFNSANVSARPAATNFSFLPNTRFSGDDHMGTAADAAACQQQCAAEGSCDCYTFCASPATPGCPDGPSCWYYAASQNATNHSGPGFTSGCALPSNASSSNVTLWTAFAGATPAQTDTFGFYPIYPSEALGGLLPLSDADRLTAQRSSRAFTGSWVSDRRPLDVFVAATLGLAGAGAALAPEAFAPADVLAGLNAYLGAYMGRNLLAAAPGGGVENAGVSRAVSEMLLGSALLAPAGAAPAGAAWYARLFPAWPAAAPARFAGLVAKGGCEYAAELAAGGAVASPVGAAAAFARAGARAANCTLRHPWPAQPRARVAVACAGAAVPVVWLSALEGGAAVDLLSFLAPSGDGAGGSAPQCEVALTSA